MEKVRNDIVHEKGRADKLPRPSLDICLEEMRELRRFQDNAIQVLDNKAGILMGFLGVLVPLSVTKLYFDHFLQGLLSVSYMLSLLVAFTSVMKGLRIREYRFDPAPNVLTRDYMFREVEVWSGDKPSAKEQILVDQVEGYNRNEKVLNDKASSVQHAMWFLLPGLILFLAQYFWPDIVPVLCRFLECSTSG